MFVASNSLWITCIRHSGKTRFAPNLERARCNLLGCASSRCGNHGAELIIMCTFWEIGSHRKNASLGLHATVMAVVFAGRDMPRTASSLFVDRALNNASE